MAGDVMTADERLKEARAMLTTYAKDLKTCLKVFDTAPDDGWKRKCRAELERAERWLAQPDDVPVVQEARRIAKCNVCDRVADNSMAGQRCFLEDACGVPCDGTLFTVT